MINIFKYNHLSSINFDIIEEKSIIFFISIFFFLSLFIKIIFIFEIITNFVLNFNLNLRRIKILIPFSKFSLFSLLIKNKP